MNRRTRVWLCLTLTAVWCSSALLAQNDERPRGPASAPDVRGSMEQLRSAALKPLATTSSAQDLQQAVRRLQALRLEPEQGLAGKVTSKPAASQPTSLASDAIMKPRPAALTPAVIKRIMELPHTEIVNPAGLADALFQAGWIKPAFTFYELALKSQQSPEDKAWVLYQMGNCCRTYDPARAKQIYQRLLEECPGSPWGPPAELQSNLSEWYEINKPMALLADAKADLAGK